MDQSQYPESLCVLVVDDCPDTTASMALLLNLWGYQVLVANNGEQALHQAITSAPQVVLLDVAMPGMSGLELARQLRRLPGLQSVPLVALTGCSQQDDRAQMLAAGCDLYLLKPVDPERLRRLLEQYEERQHQAHREATR